jgi:hypothetical protein
MAFSLRRWFVTWGSTPAERSRVMSGDRTITDPTYTATLGVTIHASARCIWPWLVQMGNGRGGLYSYDWLDRLFGYLDHPSANRVLPEFQHLAAGDEIPIGVPQHRPHAEDDRIVVVHARARAGCVSDDTADAVGHQASR